jgi:hypothetical protein
MRHRAPERFRRKEALTLEIAGPELASARLYFRHVNQAERWQAGVMDRKGGSYVAAIPGAYTDSAYPLQYYFELKSTEGRAWVYPGFPADLAGAPYYVVR